MLSISGLVRPALGRACGRLRILARLRRPAGLGATITVQGSTAPSSGRPIVVVGGRGHHHPGWHASRMAHPSREPSAPGRPYESCDCGIAWRGLVPELPHRSEHQRRHPFTTMGTVTLKEGATLDVSGQLDEFGTPIGNGNSGTVFVRRRPVGHDGCFDDPGQLPGGAVDGASTAVDIQVSQDVTLTNGSTITTVTSGPGSGGDVQLTARTLTMENGSHRS